MTRHPLRWDSLVLGLFFLAVVANWIVRRQDLLTGRELSLLGSTVLILLGLLGVAATLWRARPHSHDPHTDLEGPAHEEADPQP